uniref:Uncharacterized protein n=1 Tax=Knipowitschia caucasica TaxID=637954 RepID=A0AAV2J810_KNICA
MAASSPSAPALLLDTVSTLAQIAPCYVLLSAARDRTDEQQGGGGCDDAWVCSMSPRDATCPRPPLATVPAERPEHNGTASHSSSGEQNCLNVAPVNL